MEFYIVERHAVMISVSNYPVIVFERSANKYDIYRNSLRMNHVLGVRVNKG